MCTDNIEQVICEEAVFTASFLHLRELKQNRIDLIHQGGKMEAAKSSKARYQVNRRSASAPERCWKWFTRFFPRGFRDTKYLDWERGYKLQAHEQWQESLGQSRFRKLLKENRFEEIASTAIRIESRTNLLFSFEKMALRDAVRSEAGARVFALELYELLHGRGSLATKFDRWCDAIGQLPRRRTRVLTHPVVTVFPFIANPANHIFLKPNVTKDAARLYGFDFQYDSTPSWKVYSQLLEFAQVIVNDLKAKGPRDMIDIQSFVWVIGSDEYKDMAA
jgi:hypothetical protein